MTRVSPRQLIECLERTGSISPTGLLTFPCWCVICCAMCYGIMLSRWAEESDKSTFGWDQCYVRVFFAVYEWYTIDFFGDDLIESRGRCCFVYVVGHRYVRTQPFP